MRLGVDPRHADQMVRGTVVLPHGLGKTEDRCRHRFRRPLKDAEAAGADFVGGEELVEKIQKENWTDFDAAIATPDMMKSVGTSRQGARPQGPDAEPQDRHRHQRCCRGGEGDQGR